MLTADTLAGKQMENMYVEGGKRGSGAGGRRGVQTCMCVHVCELVTQLFCRAHAAVSPSVVSFT